MPSALLRMLTNLVNGRSDPDLPWKWYDWCLLLEIGAGIVVVMGWS